MIQTPIDQIAETAKTTQDLMTAAGLWLKAGEISRWRAAERSP
jgi:hypothetical protein